MTLKRFSIVFLFLMSLFVLAACGGGEETAAEPTAAPAEEAVAEPTAGRVRPDPSLVPADQILVGAHGHRERGGCGRGPSDDRIGPAS